jgi:hypothetical protein
MTPVLRGEALVPYLRCPDRRCRQPVINVESGRRYSGALRCIRSSCRQHWFVESLDAGDVRAQLAELWDGNLEWVDYVMRRDHLPSHIDQAMYYQIPLSTELWSGYVSSRGDPEHQRRRHLLTRVFESIHRRAS